MFKLFGKKSEVADTQSQKRFFSVLLSPNFVQAAMWETAETVKVLTKSSLRPFFGDNDLLVKLDQCLQELGSEGEAVHQTLFHLDSSYIVGNDISPEKKNLFQKITEMLQLESLGFVTNTESVVNAKLELAPELARQLVIEFTTGKVIYTLYDGKNLVETISGSDSEDFATQFKGVLVQLAGQLGADYTSFFEAEASAPTTAPAEPLVVDLVSAQITSEELTSKLNTLPASLPLKTEVLGSELLLSYILVPSATIIARSYGWISEPEPEVPANPASVPPEPAANTEEPLPVLSRQRQVSVPSVEATDFEPVPTEKKSMSHGAKMGLLVMVIVLLLIGVAAGVFWWLVSSGQAKVTLEPDTNYIAKTLEVIIDPEAKEADYEHSILPGTVKAGSVETEISYPTTGTKNIGEKAKGKVEIINKTTSERTIAKGTEIENGAVSFTLNDEIKIDAAKVEENSDGKKVEYAKKEVNVTAVTLGTSGNIKSGTSLRVGSAVKDDLEAVAKEDFTGGTDKTVKIFSEEDQKAALAMAEEELLTAAAEQIEPQKGDTYQAPQLDELEIVSREFDTDVGEEAETVLLVVKASVPVIAYKLDELEPLSQAALEKLLPEGYEFVGGLDLLSNVNDKKSARGDGQIYIDVDLSQQIVSVIDTEAVKSALLGQNIAKAENILSNFDGIKANKIEWSNQLTPSITGKLPASPDKLQVVTGVVE